MYVFGYWKSCIILAFGISLDISYATIDLPLLQFIGIINSKSWSNINSKNGLNTSQMEVDESCSDSYSVSSDTNQLCVLY